MENVEGGGQQQEEPLHTSKQEESGQKEQEKREVLLMEMRRRYAFNEEPFLRTSKLAEEFLKDAEHYAERGFPRTTILSLEAFSPDYMLSDPGIRLIVESLIKKVEQDAQEYEKDRTGRLRRPQDREEATGVLQDVEKLLGIMPEQNQELRDAMQERLRSIQTALHLESQPQAAEKQPRKFFRPK